MKRLFLSALLVLPGALLLSGCGGGSGQAARSSHKTTRVTLKISLPASVISKLAASRAASAARQGASRAASGQNGRLIPSNSASLVVYYTGLNAGGGIITKSLNAVAVTPASPQTPLTATIPDLAAGVDNIIAAALYDGPPTGTAPILPSGAAIATGSSTVNISVGSASADNSINITLQSVVIGSVQFALGSTTVTGGTAAILDTAQHTVTVQGINSTAQGAPVSSASALVTTVNGANLRWSVSDPTILQISTTTGSTVAPITGTSIQVQRRKPGTATVSVTYSESVTTAGPQTTTQAIKSDGFSITSNASFSLASAGTGILHERGSATNLQPGNAYDVTGEGYVAQADTAGAGSGSGGTDFLQYSIANALSGSLFSGANFTSNLPSGRVSYFRYPPPPGTPASYIGYSVGTSLYQVDTSGGVGWNFTITPTIVDQEARGQNVYVLENVGGGVYQIEVHSQSDGSLTRTLPLSLGFTPARVAAIELPGETDLYVASAGSAGTQIAQIKVGTTTTTNASFATLANIVDIASGYDYTNFVTDTRFLYVLTTTGITVLPTDGTAAVATTGLASGTVTPIALSTAYNSTTGVTNVYALGDTATNARIQGLQLP